MSDKASLYKYVAFFVMYEISVYLANDMIMPGMVKVVKEFHAPFSYAATSLTYFIIGGCSLPLFLNILIQKIGSRKVLLFGNILFIIATIVIACVQDIHQFLFARLLQGMGLGFIFIGYATVHELFDDIRAIKIIALISNISILAPLAGPIIGGAITNVFDWRFVFIFVGILGATSYYGIYKYMPNIAPMGNRINGTLKLYLEILMSRTFLFGTLIGGLNGITTINWIGISPVIILQTYKEPFSTYAIDQIIVFSGSIISNIMLQFILIRFKTLQLVKFGSVLSLTGLIFSFIFSFGNHTLSVIGLLIFTLGAGLYIGVINRIIISKIKHGTGEAAALNYMIGGLLSCCGLEMANYVCAKISYTFPTLALFNLMMGISCFSLTMYFVRSVKEHNWS